MLLNYKRATGNNVAPVPPQRHSSIRANAPVTPPTANNNNMPMFGNNAGNLAHATSVSRLITDLESRFVFHNVTEFPKPPPFLNIPKVYTAKANAPLPGTNINNNNNNFDGQSTNTATPTTAGASTDTTAPAVASGVARKQPAQPLFPLGVKKHRAPAPPPQAGVAAATVSVIRQSSFLYGSAGVGGAVAQQQQQQAQQW